MREAWPPSQAPPCTPSAWQTVRRSLQEELPLAQSWAEGAAPPAEGAARSLAQMQPHLHGMVSFTSPTDSQHMHNRDLPCTVNTYIQSQAGYLLNGIQQQRPLHKDLNTPFQLCLACGYGVHLGQQDAD